MRSLLLLIALLSVVVTAVPTDPVDAEADPASEVADQPKDDLSPLSLDFSPENMPLEDSTPLPDTNPTRESDAPLLDNNSEATEDGFKPESVDAPLLGSNSEATGDGFKLESIDTPASLDAENQGRGKDENGVIQPNFRTTLKTEKAPTSTEKKTTATTKKRRNSFNNLVNFPGLKRSNGGFLGGLKGVGKARFNTKPNFNNYDKVDYKGLLNGMKFKPNLKKSVHTAKLNFKTASLSTRKRNKKQKGKRSGSSSNEVDY